LLFFEPIRISVPPSDPRAPGIPGAAYGRIAERILAAEGVLDHCLVTYAASAENASRKPKRIGVTVLKQTDDEGVAKSIEAYGMAHWFGHSLLRGRYVLLPPPFDLWFGKRKRAVEIAELLFLREKISIGTLRRRKGETFAAVATHFDPLASPVDYVALNMPEYDYYSCPTACGRHRMPSRKWARFTSRLS
jgi:hypothetical protein